MHIYSNCTRRRYPLLLFLECYIEIVQYQLYYPIDDKLHYATYAIDAQKCNDNKIIILIKWENKRLIFCQMAHHYFMAYFILCAQTDNERVFGALLVDGCPLNKIAVILWNLKWKTPLNVLCRILSSLLQPKKN